MRSNALPKPPGVPILGHAHRWAQNPFTIGSWANEEAGGVAKIELFNTELVLVTDPEPIEEVLVEKRRSIPKSEQYKIAFGEGLGSVSGEQWRKQRDVITQFFQPTRIDSFADSMVSLADSQSDTWCDGEEIPIFHEMKELTIQILFETIFDYTIDPRGKDEDILKAIDDLDEWFKPTSWALPKWIPTPARRRFSRASSRVDAIAEDLLNDADANDESLLAMLQEMNQRGRTSLSEEEIQSQLRTFIFAGHETTAVTTSFALQLLSNRSDVESRFHDELDLVLDGSKPEFDDLGDLSVTENIVREILRLYPPAFRLPRVAAEDVEIGGYPIEAETDILVYTVPAHRNEQFWDAPTEFRPSRWDDIDPESRGFEYIPFGAGPRGCIGKRFALLETRLLLATLGQENSFEPRSDLEISARVSAAPKGSLPARVERR
jgi:cytochrome P450